MNDLKDCPFCGSMAELIYNSYEKAFRVQCINCPANTGYDRSREWAMTVWNRRRVKE